MRIHILNYLDDWLILAQLEAELTSYSTLLLSHLERLGLRVNFSKSALRYPPASEYRSWGQFSTQLRWEHSHTRTCSGHAAALAPWKKSQWMEKGVALGMVLQKQGRLDRCFQHGLRSSVRRQTDFRPLVEGGGRALHQLPGNASNVSGPSVLPARPKRTPRVGQLRQLVRGVLHKSPVRSLL